MAQRTAAEFRPDLGAPLSEVETPALVVDVDVMERNVRDFADFAAEHDVRLRSHVKTHKNAAIAHLQDRVTDGGGVTVQTLGEAEVMADNGIDDVFLSYEVVGDRKLARLVRLSERLEAFATTVDGPANVDALASAAAARDATVDAVLEVDIGYGRTGCRPADAVDLARRIDDAASLRFRGVMAYEAHVKEVGQSRGEYERRCEEAMEDVARVVADLTDAGLDVPEVKVGGTATSKFSGTHPIVTEINPGMYPFNDVGELRARPFAVSTADCAATVVTTVVSRRGDRAVVDAGSKAIARDSGYAPVAVDGDGVAYERSSEEHGWLDVSDASSPPEVGDRLRFVPPHVCTTFNLHDVAVGVSDDRVTDFFPVQARGKVT